MKTESDAMYAVWNETMYKSDVPKPNDLICEIDMKNQRGYIWNGKFDSKKKEGKYIEIELPPKETVAIAFANFGASKQTVTIVDQYFK